MPTDRTPRRPLTLEERRARRAHRRRQVRRRRLVALGGLATAGVIGLGTMVASLGGGGATAEARGATSPVDIAATGDIVMGSDGYGLPPDGGRGFFAPVDDLIAGDVVIGNLEGTLATGGSSKCGGGSPNCFAFRTPPSYARHLRAAGFTVMNLANNHAYDYGASGQAETVRALRRAGLLDTGRPGTVAVTRVRGTRVAVLGFASYPWADPLLDIAAARERVRTAREAADVVVVTFHGGAEGAGQTRVRPGPETYLGEPRGDLIAFSHAVVDEGADLVVGHGPHVLRGMEVYRGRLIAYSLGNFAGYEVFGLGGPLSTSAVLQARLGPDGRLLSARIRPTRLVGKGTPAPGGDAIRRIAELSRADFGRRAPVIAPDGRLLPPPGSPQSDVIVPVGTPADETVLSSAPEASGQS